MNHLIITEVSLSIKLAIVDMCGFSFRSFMAVYINLLGTPVSRAVTRIQTHLSHEKFFPKPNLFCPA
jgi:hypothetical protein